MPKIAFKSMHNWRRYPTSNWYETDQKRGSKFGAMLCTSTFLALNYCGGIFFKTLSYLYEVVRTNFCADFWLFEIFERNFAKLVAPPSNNNKNYLVYLKGQSMLKKRCKQCQNRSINRDTTSVQSMSPSNEQRAGLGAWQTEKNIVTNTIFSHLQPAHVVQSSPNFAWW